MRRGLRLLAYAGAILLWLVVMTLPFAAAALAIQGEIEVGGSAGRHLRIFLIQEGSAEGVGVTWARPVPAGPNCRRTTVTYLLWRGRGENVSYCLCYDPAAAETISSPVCP
jgi:hypothetical protein